MYDLPKVTQQEITVETTVYVSSLASALFPVISSCSGPHRATHFCSNYEAMGSEAVFIDYYVPTHIMLTALNTSPRLNLMSILHRGPPDPHLTSMTAEPGEVR